MSTFTDFTAQSDEILTTLSQPKPLSNGGKLVSTLEDYMKLTAGYDEEEEDDDMYAAIVAAKANLAREKENNDNTNNSEETSPDPTTETSTSTSTTTETPTPTAIPTPTQTPTQAPTQKPPSPPKEIIPTKQPTQNPNTTKSTPYPSYVFHCNNATRATCLNLSLFGNTTPNPYCSTDENILKNSLIWLFNLNKKVLEGPFYTTGDGAFDIEEQAWDGKYPYQIPIAIGVPLAEDQTPHPFSNEFPGKQDKCDGVGSWEVDVNVIEPGLGGKMPKFLMDEAESYKVLSIFAGVAKNRTLNGFRPERQQQRQQKKQQKVAAHQGSNKIKPAFGKHQQQQYQQQYQQQNQNQQQRTQSQSKSNNNNTNNNNNSNNNSNNGDTKKRVSDASSAGAQAKTRADERRKNTNIRNNSPLRG